MQLFDNLCVLYGLCARFSFLIKSCKKFAVTDDNIVNIL